MPRNSDKRTASRRAYEARNKAKRYAKVVAWRKSNPDKVKAHNRKGNAKLKDYHKSYSAKWIKENPDKAQEYKAKRKAIHKRLITHFTAGQWRALKQQYSNTCLCCLRSEPEIKLCVDHVIPLSKGGPNTIDNIQPLCKSCNSSKGTSSADFRFCS